MTGHHVYELNSLSEQNILPVGQLQNGLYILKVQYPGRAPETQKIIISHQSTH